MAGRPRKPTAVKVLAGNPGKRALPKGEPRPTSKLPPPPAHLTKDAKAEWQRLAEQLGKLGLATGIDMAAFAAYCEAYATWIQAKRVIAKKGLTFEANGMVRKRPEVAIANDALRIMRQYAGEFGLTPSSRVKVAAAIADGRQPLLPMDLPEKEDPAKPKVPSAAPAVPLAEMTDDEFLGGDRPN